MKKETKENIDSILFDYSDRKNEALPQAIQILHKLYEDIDIDCVDIVQLEFDLQGLDKLSDEFRQKQAEYFSAVKMDRFLGVFENFVAGYINANKDDINNLSNNDIKDYIKNLR